MPQITEQSVAAEAAAKAADAANTPRIDAKKYPTIDKGYSMYGAQMGRREWEGTPADRTVRVFHLPIDSQGYDVGGAYWGTGQRIYCATDSDALRKFIRAANRAEAIQLLDLPAEWLMRA